jgi:LacI family transcriptional regulator
MPQRSLTIQPAYVQLLDDEQMPYVLLGRRTDHASTSYVAPDNAEGAYALTQHLIEQGNTRIAFMTRPLHGPTNNKRFEGYCRAIQEAGLSFDATLVVETALEPDSGYHAMRRLLDLTEVPSAVIAFNDLLAVDALRAASRRGLTVPGDVAIAGFDGLQSSLTTEPQITTVQQPLREMGQRAVHILLERVAEPDLPPRRETFPIQLLIRGSTRR